MTTTPAGSAAPTRPVDPTDPAAPLPDRDAAAAYVASVCFKHGPPRLLGLELEWLVRHADDPARPVDPSTLVRALGPYTPPTLCAGAVPAPLPAGSALTVEPGGQVELASPPAADLGALIALVAADLDVLRERLATERLTLVRRAADPLRAPRRILQTPRYTAMEAAFDRIGPHGRTGMCSTAAIQVCLDAGQGRAVVDRWDALHEMGPVLTGTFANSPTVHGRRTGWKSTRMASWLSLDPERTAPPATADDPAAAWAERAMTTSLLCTPRGDGSWAVPPGTTFADWVDGRSPLTRRPTRADLDYHLTTIFPPVRPRGHMEVRYLDQQPDDEWAVPTAVVTAVLADDDVLDRARAAVAPVRDLWAAAARGGLADPRLARAAVDLLEVAHDALGALPVPPALRAQVGRVLERRVRAGRCPADETLDEPGEPDPGPPRDEAFDLTDLAGPTATAVPGPTPAPGGDRR